MMINETPTEARPGLEKIPYPSTPFAKYAFKSPILLWRMGLGPVLGRFFMVLTTIGRKSGLPRRAPLEYQRIEGRKYVVSAWAHSDWYRNMLANPNVTVQTSAGVESMRVRRVTEDDELSHLYPSFEMLPTFRMFWQMLGFELNLSSFLKHKNHLHLLVFDPTDDPTPAPLQPDLTWIWGIAIVAGLSNLILYRLARRKSIGNK